MKTILLAPTPPPHGGIAEWTQRMLKIELKNGWRLEVVDEKVSQSRGAYTRKRNYLEEIKRSLRIWSDLNKKLKDVDVRIVHCCIPATTFAMLREYISAIITKLHKRKFIIHFRCTVPNMVQGKMSMFILKILCDKSNVIMILNRQTENFLKKITSTKQVLIPNFVSNTELNMARMFEVREIIKRVIYVGGVMPSKGCDSIIELAKRFPKIQFQMIGKVDNIIKKLVDSYKLSNVELLGTMSNERVIKYLCKSDIFIFMTHYDGEGFSNALLEAMAVGLPCLVTDWAANKDMIEDKGGCVISIRDVDAAEKALQSMLSKDIRQVISEWNKKKVRESYNSDIITDKYVQVYEKFKGI